MHLEIQLEIVSNTFAVIKNNETNNYKEIGKIYAHKTRIIMMFN